MTRIIAGKWRGKRLAVPSGRDIRPTTDRMRERLFSMLMHPRYPSLIGSVVLDAYAGTGALGLEALSRGAGQAIFFEQAPQNYKVLIGNIASVGASAGEAKPQRCDSLRPSKALQAADFIFLDPPYSQDLLAPTIAGLARTGWIKDGTILICEMAKTDTLTLPLTAGTEAGESGDDATGQTGNTAIQVSDAPAPLAGFTFTEHDCRTQGAQKLMIFEADTL